PHQANMRIIQATTKRLDLPISHFHMIIEEVANTSAASVGLALDDALRRGLVKRGDLVLTVGFGAGLTSGGNLIEL
ncbi:MAG: 3-oxoacyl-ACP synthase, partial [Lentisphaeria bacterium]|nr:3-oxoacyl-ACP synthase [Lentisphaeria bacterium]